MGTSNSHKSATAGGNGNYKKLHPMTTTKPTFQKRGNTTTKKIRFHSVSCEDAAKQESFFNKLDAANPEQRHKILQRRKAIEKGKNTVGYDEYCRQMPKEKRRKRCMETPSTPDYTLDIPNKKWNGMVKAWYDSIISFVIVTFVLFMLLTVLFFCFAGVLHCTNTTPRTCKSHLNKLLQLESN
jgi:hypothetical protein